MAPPIAGTLLESARHLTTAQTTSLYEQSPPLGIDLAVVSPAQRRSQVALEQLTEHEFVQVMWQVELPPHEALPLGPSVAVQVELPVQLKLQDLPHAPTHSVWFEQEIEQLPALPPQVAALKEQLDPELQVQLAPLQMGGGAAEEPPQAWRRTTSPITVESRMTNRNTADGRFKLLSSAPSAASLRLCSSFWSTAGSLALQQTTTESSLRIPASFSRIARSTLAV